MRGGGIVCWHLLPAHDPSVSVADSSPCAGEPLGASKSLKSVAERLLNYSLFIIHFSLKKKNPPMVDQTIGGFF